MFGFCLLYQPIPSKSRRNSDSLYSSTWCLATHVEYEYTGVLQRRNRLRCRPSFVLHAVLACAAVTGYVNLVYFLLAIVSSSISTLFLSFSQFFSLIGANAPVHVSCPPPLPAAVLHEDPQQAVPVDLRGLLAAGLGVLRKVQGGPGRVNILDPFRLRRCM